MAAYRAASGWAGASILKGVCLAESPEESLVVRVPALLRCASPRRTPPGHLPYLFPILCPCWRRMIYFSNERGRFRSGFEMHTCPCPLNLPTSNHCPPPSAWGPEGWRPGRWTGTEHRVGTAKRASEWEIFMSEICSWASLIMLFIFLSKSSH